MAKKKSRSKVREFFKALSVDIAGQIERFGGPTLVKIRYDVDEGDDGATITIEVRRVAN